MKIKIVDLEKKLNKKIKRNFTSVGVDTASVTGIVFLKSDKEYLYINGSVLGFHTKNKKEIYGSMIRTFGKMFTTEDIAIIEDIFIGFNRKGSLELARYGAFALAECIKKDIPYEIILAQTARAKFKIDTRSEGKGKSKIAVGKWVFNLGIDLKDNNLVDGFVLGLLGICEDVDFAPKTKKKKKKRKTKKRKKK
jgi:hypothetical protein